MNALQELEFNEITEVTEQKERFSITDLDSANWAFRKIEALKIEVKKNVDLAYSEKQRIDEWERKINKPLDDSIAFFESLLMNYHAEQRQLDSKFKLSTPYGSITTRKMPKAWIYDDTKVLESVKANGMNKYIKTKETLDKALFKKELTVHGEIVVNEDGVIIEGVKVVEQPDSVKVTTNE